MMENHPLPIWANETATGRVLYSNPAANKIYGNSPQSHENQKIANFLNDPQTSLQMLDELRRGGSIDNYDVQTKNEAGEEIWISGCARLAFFKDTEIVVSSIQNITDRKKLENENQKSVETLRDAIESLTEGFALYDNEHRLVMFNQMYQEMNGLVADLLEPGLPYEMLLREMVRRGGYADAAGREDEWVAERLDNATIYAKDDEINHSNGKSYLVSIHPTALGGFVVTRTDITARKQAIAQQRDGDLLVRTVLDASSAIVIMARTGDGEILYRSQAAYDMFGNTKSAREHYAEPEERADFVTEMLSDGEVNDYRLMVNARDGVKPASISARFAEYRGEEVIVASVIDLTEQMKAVALIQQVLEACPVPLQMTRAETGETLFCSPQTIELFGETAATKNQYVDVGEREASLRALRRDGFVRNRRAKYYNGKGEEFWGAASAQLINFDGEEVIVSSTRDLTDELALQDELAAQREMLFQNEKMSALGELLAGVAHELNNPLSIVVGHALMLREDEHNPETLRRIEKISAAAERSAKIVKTFLAMARQKPSKMEVLDIRSIIETAIDVAGYGHKNDDLTMTYQVHENIPEIIADGDQITQVIINLIINAAHAIEGAAQAKGNVTVEAKRAKSGREVEISVTDTGPGIPENIRARIFEPFFTTKEVGDGTGIGLAFCHRIIHSHGGRIRLENDYINGSRFLINLPMAISKLEELTTIPKSETPFQTVRALIVDDEVDVAELVAEILTRDGFEVEQVHSGAGAVERLNSKRFDLILSDLNMPELDGRGLYEAIQSEFPDMIDRLGFITGDTMGNSSQKLLQESNRPFLEKPVAPNELRELVQGILAQAKEAH